MTDEELTTLRLKLWRSKGRRTRELGAFLLGTSILIFLLAFITNSLLFEVTSVIALFLGMIFLFSGVESHVGTRQANLIAKSPLLSFKELIKDLPGRALYLYKSENRPRFILTENVPAKGATRTNGRTFLSLGNDLVSLYEEELGDLRGRGMEYLVEWLPRILVDSLKLAEEVKVDLLPGEEVEVAIKKPTFDMLCLSQDIRNGICNTVGCQVQSSIAQAISLATKQNVFFKGCVYKDDGRTAVATYQLKTVT